MIVDVQINQTGRSYSSKSTKISNWTKSPRKFQNRTNDLRYRRPSRKNRNTEYDFIHRRRSENFVKLRRKIEESIRYKSNPEENVVNLTAFSFWKSEYKLLNRNLDLIPTPKVCNKNELDNEINNFFRLIKLKAHFQDSINKDTDDENRMLKASKKQKQRLFTRQKSSYHWHICWSCTKRCRMC